MSGRLRFGAADELALSELPTILREFRQLYPRINLELTVTQSGTLLPAAAPPTTSTWSSSTSRPTPTGAGWSVGTGWSGSGWSRPSSTRAGRCR